MGIEITIIIISFNTKKLLDGCLSSVYKSLFLSNLQKISEVIVIDNASTDGSSGMVEKKYPAVLLIKNRENEGFGKANNRGIKISKGEYVMLLNSDTIIEHDSIYKMWHFLKNNQYLDIIGPKILNSGGSLQYSAGFFPTLLNIFCWMFLIDDLPLIKRLFKSYHISSASFYSGYHEVDWLTGACLFVKKSILPGLFPFDEHIFMYGEEVDLCYQIKNSGGRVAYYPNAQIIHLKGRSSIGGADAGILEEFKFIIHFFGKFKSPPEQFIARRILKSGAWLRLVLFGIIGRYPKRLPLYAKALKMV